MGNGASGSIFFFFFLPGQAVWVVPSSSQAENCSVTILAAVAPATLALLLLVLVAMQ